VRIALHQEQHPLAQPLLQGKETLAVMVPLFRTLQAAAAAVQVPLVLQQQASQAALVELLLLHFQHGQLQQVQELATIMQAAVAVVQGNQAVFQVQEPLAVAGALLTVLL
jgi:hypothetical protein